MRRADVSNHHHYEAVIGSATMLLLLLLQLLSTPAADAFFLPSPISSTSTSISSSMTRRGTSLSIRKVTSGFDNHNQDASSSSPSVVDSLEGKFFDWKHDWRIHYVEAGAPGSPPLLLCPGFGVNVNHFERNIDRLAASHRTYAIDLLGQGKSWPEGDPKKEHNLVFSIDTWQEQVITFIREVIGQPCYIAGNSLGGFLATAVAAQYPDMVKGVILLNSTPFWSFAPSRKKMSEWVKNTIIPYDGTLPPPEHLFKIGAKYYDGLRNPTTVKAMLKAVYSNDAAWDDRLVQHILQPTYHRLGHAVFTSILFAPKPEHTFEEYLARVQAPMCLLYGKEDPWITPVWGQKIKKQRPEATYYELSPAGHCPHHESPTAVNTLISEWIQEVENATGDPLPQTSSSKARIREFQEAVTGATVTATRQDGTPRNVIEWLISNTLLRA